MAYEVKKQLKRLNDKQFAEDIKRYITSTHEFYGSKIPELNVLAKRLHEEYNLKDFYRVFNRLWKRGYPEERLLAIYALELYKEDFDFNTWLFLKTKLKDIKNLDQIDFVASNIIGYILLKYPRLEKEIINFAYSKDIWLKKIALISTIPLIQKGEFNFAVKLIELCLHSKEIVIQKAVGLLIREIGDKRPESAKRFILKNSKMPQITFEYATENMKELRQVKKIKKLNTDEIGRSFWLWKS